VVESWAKESFEIATKIAYRNGGRIGIPRASMDCTMVAAAPVVPVGYVVNARRISDRRMILAGYRFGGFVDSSPRELTAANTAGRSGGFFEKGNGFLSDVFHRQAMPAIRIENEAVGFLGGLEGVA